MLGFLNIPRFSQVLRIDLKFYSFVGLLLLFEQSNFRSNILLDQAL